MMYIKDNKKQKQDGEESSLNSNWTVSIHEEEIQFGVEASVSVAKRGEVAVAQLCLGFG